MPLILGTNSIKDTGYDVANSLRFNSGSSDSLNRSASAGNRKTFTISSWIKPSTTGYGVFFSGKSASTSYANVQFPNGSSKLQFTEYQNGDTINLETNRLFRDISAWWHVVIAVDTTQGTASNRIKLYLNGVQETSFATETYPSQNADTVFNSSSSTHRIGCNNDADGGFFNGYIAETVLIDGSQLAPDQFGEFDSDSGIWKPIDVSGLTFGNNGFYLDFEDSSNLGNDANGGTDFGETNLAATDQSTDTCTNNSCTMNPLNIPVSNKPTFSEGNLKTVTSSSGSGRFGGTSTFGVTQGKWYVEAKATVGSTYSRNSIGVSYNPAEMARNNSDNTLTDTSYAWGWDSSGGDVYHDSSVVVNYATYATGDICQIFLDLDNHKLYYGKNGSLQSSTGISLDTGETYFIAQIDRTGGSDVSTFEFNFGSPIYAISSSNTDGEYGNFEYSTTITGDGASKTFKALNTKNLAEFG